MSVYNNSIQYAARGNDNNPLALQSYIKPGRILINNVNPLINTGELNDYYINSVSGDFFGPKSDVWGSPVYNFTTGSGGTGITTIENIGEGIGIFKDIVGSTAHLKTLVSTGNQINITPDIPILNSITLSMSDAYKPVTLSKLGNFPLEVGLGSGTADPNGVLGSPDYNRGSLFVQVGTTDTIWVCNDAAAKIWLDISGTGEGVNDIENVGSGAGTYLDTVGGVARLKGLQGTTNQIEVSSSSVFQTNTIEMSDNYKPVTLSNIDNVKIGYGSPSAPLPSDDNTKGYVKGSLFTEVEPSGQIKLWICKSPVPPALWRLYTGGDKEYASWESQGGQPQSIIGIGFQDVDFGVGVPTNNTPYAGSVFTTLNDGTRQVFRRLTGDAGKAYNVTLNMSLFSNLGPTIQEALYTVRMIRKTGTLIVRQSQGGCIFPYSTINNRNNFISVSFVYQESLSGQQDYYFQISGTVGGVSANDVDIDYWSMSISEI